MKYIQYAGQVDHIEMYVKCTTTTFLSIPTNVKHNEVVIAYLGPCPAQQAPVAFLFDILIEANGTHTTRKHKC